MAAVRRFNLVLPGMAEEPLVELETLIFLTYAHRSLAGRVAT